MNPKLNPTPETDRETSARNLETRGAATIAYPRLVLRVAFAGWQKIDADDVMLQTKLLSVFEVMAQVLAEVAPNVSAPGEKQPASVAQFYSWTELPLIRLVTGLCQGGDALANRTRKTFAGTTHGRQVKTELSAVLPFEVADYRSGRPAEFQSEFVEQAGECSYILVLDSKYKKDHPSDLEKLRRARAYRAQSTLLLRQCDLLIVMTDPSSAARAGGSMETLRSAMTFNLPVVFIHAGTTSDQGNSDLPSGDSGQPGRDPKGCVTLIEPGDDPASTFSGLEFEQRDWKRNLRSWVEHLTADPDIDLARPGVAGDYTPNLLSEFFADVKSPEPKPLAEIQRRPPKGISGLILGIAVRLAHFRHAPESWKIFFLDSKFYRTDKSLFGITGLPLLSAQRLTDRRTERKTGLGEKIWDVLNRHCSPGYGPKGDEKFEPYTTWRGRTTSLNYYYSGNYRGVFVLNYILAPLAVFLATLGLLLLLHEGLYLLYALVTLALLKLIILAWILINTILVNGRNWNDRAVDYRYLAERLRSMLYLARIGSFQPPAATPRRRANQVVRQSAVDWLFNAIVRSVSPASLAIASDEETKLGGTLVNLRILRPAPIEALTRVRDSWVRDQAIYHDKNAFTNESIYIFLEKWVGLLNVSVITLVSIDLLIVTLVALGVLSKASLAHEVSHWLIFLAAIIPTMVASINAVRVQSECRRLAQRSALMCDVLWGKDPLPATKTTWLNHLFPTSGKRTPPDPAHGKNRWGATEALIAKIRGEKADPETDPQSWTPEALRMTESVAEVFVQEVTEWSVLYAKEVPEP